MVVCHLFLELVDKQRITALFTIPDKQRARQRGISLGYFKIRDSIHGKRLCSSLGVLLLAISVWLLLYDKILCGCTISLVSTDLVGIWGFFCLQELLEHIKVAQAQNLNFHSLFFSFLQWLHCQRLNDAFS